ncbi:hypothetical protein Tco_0361292 [Tanacetum coccineum]
MLAPSGGGLILYQAYGNLYALIDMEDDVDINALTMEQYIALIPNDIKPGIVNPKICDDVEFEINANFMRELRRKLFAGTDDEDAYEHVRTDETTTRIRINDVLDNVDAIYESFKGEHPTKEHPLKKEDEAIKHRSGYQQKDRKPSQNDKTEHGMEKTVQNQGQSQKNAKVRVNTEESAVKPEPELKNTIG